MNLTVYHSSETVNEILDDFITAYYGQGMSFFASDLLKDDFTTEQIMQSVRRAIESGRTAGLNVRKHFKLCYTTLEGAIVRDCKLTRLGYALVVLNGPPTNQRVAECQLQLVNQFLKG